MPYSVRAIAASGGRSSTCNRPPVRRAIWCCATTRLASCESLVSLRQYRPFLEKHAVDVAIIDVPWNGFSQSVQIGRLAEACEINIAPHNYYSHLADLHSLHLCAVLPNVRALHLAIGKTPTSALPLKLLDVARLLAKEPSP